MLLSLRVNFSAGPVCLSAAPAVGPRPPQEPSHLRSLIGIDLGWSERQGGPFVFRSLESAELQKHSLCPPHLSVSFTAADEQRELAHQAPCKNVLEQVFKCQKEPAPLWALMPTVSAVLMRVPLLITDCKLQGRGSMTRPRSCGIQMAALGLQCSLFRRLFAPASLSPTPSALSLVPNSNSIQ